MSNTGSENSRISFLFKKYLNGTCSDDEAREIISLLEDSKSDVSLIDAARSHWITLNADQQNEPDLVEDRLIMDQILDNLHHRMGLDEAKIVKRISVAKVLTCFSKVAAVLIFPLLIYSAYLTSRTAKPEVSNAPYVTWQTVKTTAGMQADFLLPDGSHIWLNSGSVFKYPIPFEKNRREVEITGEAYFDVAKDAFTSFSGKDGKK